VGERKLRNIYSAIYPVGGALFCKFREFAHDHRWCRAFASVGLAQSGLYYIVPIKAIVRF